MRRFFGIHLILIGSALLLVCIYFIDWQRRAIATFPPTPATIDASELSIQQGGKGGPHYSPEIAYHYVINNHLYTSRTVTTFHTEDPESARALVRNFPAGAQVFAYVDPADPTDAILVRQYSNDPYVFAFFSSVAFIAGICLCSGLFGMPSREMIAVPVEPTGNQLLVPTKTLRRRYLNALILVAACVILWPPIAGHYVWASSDYRTGVRLFCFAMVPAYFWLFYYLWRCWRLTRYFSDPRLTVNPAPMQRGQPFHMNVEFDVRSSLNIRSITAQITCFEHYCERDRGGKYTTGKRWVVGQDVTLAPAISVTPGQLLTGQGMLTFLETAPASTDRVHTDNQYPYYTWELTLQVNVAMAPDYFTAYPLLVK